MQCILEWNPDMAIGRQPRPQPERSGLSRRIWLLLYSEGGWWTSEEMVCRLHAGPVNTALQEMVTSGHIVRRKVERDERTVTEFGVTAQCKVPRGVLIMEIEAMLRLGLRGAA